MKIEDKFQCGDSFSTMERRGPNRRFCEQCQEEVLDLRYATRSRYDALMASGAPFCAAFLADDDDNIIFREEPRKSSKSLAWLAAGLLHLSFGRSFLAGPHLDSDIVQVRWYVSETDGTFMGKVYFGPGAQGPPGHAHGGSIAAVLDEALGSVCWAGGHAVVAARLETDFRTMIPLQNVYSVWARVKAVEGRRVHVEGEIVNTEQEVMASAIGVFVKVDEQVFEKFSGRFG